MRTVVVLLAALVAAEVRAAQSVDSEALRAGKGVLVLQCGSDWCVSGESVRKAFESGTFAKGKTGQQFVTAVYDDMEEPTDEVRERNRLVEPILIRTRRFPAITCYTLVDHELRVFAQIENVPNTVTAEKLSKAIQRVSQRKAQAEALFKKAASEKDQSKAADMYGQGFDILAAMMGPFHFKELVDGKCAWRREWDALVRLDAGDRYGWLAHFDLDEYRTVALVEKLTAEKTEGSKGHAEQLVEKYKAIPQTHFTTNQMQFVKILEYALLQDGTDKPLTPAGKSLMKKVFALGRDTFWGQFAMGRLMMDGEKIESRGLKPVPARPRPGNATEGVKQSFPLDQAKGQISTIKPGAKLTDAQKLSIARYAALRLIGQRGWQELTARVGSGQFIKAFMNDRVWLEDFAWSGTFPVDSSNAGCYAGTGAGDGAGAALALESLIYQDNGKWAGFADGKYEDNEGRRFMTALAQVYPDKDEAWLADVLAAYRSAAFAGRFHKSAYTQPVWLWRFAVHQGHATGGCNDSMAAQQRHLDKFMNIHPRDYHKTWISYRLKNCFGDSVHGPWYYKPWETAGEWPKRKYSQIVGGVCGELSKYSSGLVNSHGMPSTTAGQPVHCAFSYRLPGGIWQIGNNVWPPTTLHMCFWNKHAWQYTPAMEGTYSGSREACLGAERMIALANLAEESKKDRKLIEKFYQHACAAKPDHYGAWHAYGEWLMRSETPLDQLRVWVRGCARGMKTGRQPLWDILTPYFERVAREKGKEALKDDLVAFAPLLRQPVKRISEESNFSTNLTTWTEALGGDRQARYDVLKAMLEAQYGTPEYFSQTMGWGSEHFTKTADGSKLFNKCLNEAIAAAAKNTKGDVKDGGKMDFGPMLLAASRNGNVDAFRNIVKLQSKLAPLPKANGSPYPEKDFGGADLLSRYGLLQTSSTCGHDHPVTYPLAIDESPCGGGAFHTDSEESPWAAVMLGGPTDVKGIVIENRFGNGNDGRQVPIVVELSDDGKSWQQVFSSDTRQETYRVDLRNSNNTVHYVRVSRKAGARKDFFHLNKILVYGKKLY